MPGLKMILGRGLIWLPPVLVLAAAVWLWGMGGADEVGRAAAQGQRAAQNAMARALRALQSGQPGAILTLWALCFAYGFAHAAGPGHGKLVIGGYGLGRDVPVWRLSGLALASSLGQAGTAILLVLAGVAIFGWDRSAMQGMADGALNTLSYALIGAIGGWLLLRGLRRLWRLRGPVRAGAHAHDHAHDHAYDQGTGTTVCPDCGHVHGPSLQQAEAVRSWREAAAVVGAIAVRPCTGALFLLVITWQIGALFAGITGTVVMALGTATVTVAVAVASVSLRDAPLLALTTGRRALWVRAGVEAAAGAVVLILSLQLMLRGL